MQELKLDRLLAAGWIRLALWSAAWLAPATVWAHLEPGTTAPHFELPTLDQRGPLILEKVEGYRLLVLVWANQRFTTETLAMCRRLPRRLRSPRKPWQPILLWVGPLPAKTVETSVTLGQAWRVAHDRDERVGQAYQVVVSPTIYLMNPQGVITQVFPAWHPLLEGQLLGVLAKTLDAEADLTSPTSPPQVNPQDRAWLYFNLGRAMVEQGLWEEALAHFERGLALKPDSADPLAEAARAAYLAFDRDKARALAERALKLNPRHRLARAVRANLEGHPTTLRWKAETTDSLSSADLETSTTIRR